MPQRFTLAVAAIAALGGLLFGYDTGVISGAILFIQHDFALDRGAQELVVSVVLIGAMVGSLLAGGIADRFGRRATLLASGIIFAVGALASAAAPNTAWLIAARVIVGFAIGLSSVTAPLYLSESAPRTLRGALVSLYQLAVTIGIFSAYVIDLSLAASAGWRLMLGLAVVPSLLLVGGMIRMPETARYLFARGRSDDARALLTRTLERGDVDDAMTELQRTARTERSSVRDLLRPSLRRPLIVGIGLAILQQVTGINTVIYYGPQIFQLAGSDSAQAAILATAVVGLVNVLLTIVAVAFVDRWGRKPLLYLGCGGMGIALVTLAAAFGIPALAAVRAPLALVSLCAYVGCFAFSLGPIVWLMIGEVYPLDVRGRGMSVATLANWGSNFAVSLVFLTMLKALGTAPTFLVYAALCGATILFTAFVVPETKNVELERISSQTHDRVAATAG